MLCKLHNKQKNDWSWQGLVIILFTKHDQNTECHMAQFTTFRNCVHACCVAILTRSKSVILSIFKASYKLISDHRILLNIEIFGQERAKNSFFYLRPFEAVSWNEIFVSWSQLNKISYFLNYKWSNSILQLPGIEFTRSLQNISKLLRLTL